MDFQYFFLPPIRGISYSFFPVTHAPSIAERCDRIVQMADGRIGGGGSLLCAKRKSWRKFLPPAKSSQQYYYISNLRYGQRFLRKIVFFVVMHRILLGIPYRFPPCVLPYYMLSFNYRKGESNDLRSTPSRWSMGKMAPKRICNRPMNVFINGRIIALRCLYIRRAQV